MKKRYIAATVFAMFAVLGAIGYAINRQDVASCNAGISGSCKESIGYRTHYSDVTNPEVKEMVNEHEPCRLPGQRKRKVRTHS